MIRGGSVCDKGGGSACVITGAACVIRGGQRV